MSKKNDNNSRNLVAAEMGNRFKSKRFSNDRGNRRANDTRNTKAWMDEMDPEYFEDTYGNV